MGRPAGWPTATELWAALPRLARSLVDPAECRRCHARLPSSDAVLCAACRGVVCDTAPKCRRCGAPVGPHLGQAGDCVHCRDERWEFEFVRALGAYQHEPLRRAVAAAKRPGGTSAAVALGQLWAHEFVADPVEVPAEPVIAATEIDVVVPVPRHWSRRLQSSASGAERLAEAIARRIRKPLLLSAVRKTRRTPRQSSLPPSRRQSNLVGAFGPVAWSRSQAGLTRASVLLVDDVLTTGQTAHRVACVLKDMGASRVVVGVIARGTGETVSAASAAPPLQSPSDPPHERWPDSSGRNRQSSRTGQEERVSA